MVRRGRLGDHLGRRERHSGCDAAAVAVRQRLPDVARRRVAVLRRHADRRPGRRRRRQPVCVATADAVEGGVRPAGGGSL